MKCIDQRGGKRIGAGRPSKGITKKVSLTLSDELWNEINEFDGTCADYIRSLKQKITDLNKVTQINTEAESQPTDEIKKVTQFKKEENKELTKEYVQEFWKIYKNEFLRENSATDEAIKNAYESLMNSLFKGKETVQLETLPRYRSHYSGRWYSSIKNLLKVEVPKFIISAEVGIQRKKENAKRREHNEKLERMSKENLSKTY